jgi:hypothetical protein
MRSKISQWGEGANCWRKNEEYQVYWRCASLLVDIVEPLTIISRFPCSKIELFYWMKIATAARIIVFLYDGRTDEYLPTLMSVGVLQTALTFTVKCEGTLWKYSNCFETKLLIHYAK